MVPFHAEIENGQSGKTLIKLEKIELLDKLDASEFRLKPRQSGE